MKSFQRAWLPSSEWSDRRRRTSPLTSGAMRERREDFEPDRYWQAHLEPFDPGTGQLSQLWRIQPLGLSPPPPCVPARRPLHRRPMGRQTSVGRALDDRLLRFGLAQDRGVRNWQRSHTHRRGSTGRSIPRFGFRVGGRLARATTPVWLFQRCFNSSTTGRSAYPIRHADRFKRPRHFSKRTASSSSRDARYWC